MKFWNIRAIEASNQEEAIQKVECGEFDEEDVNNDKIIPAEPVKVSIIIRDGVLQMVGSNQPIEYVLIDWDNIREIEEMPTIDSLQPNDYEFTDLELHLKNLK